MAHVAFFAIADAGHVHPTLAVVEELVRRGHRVSYAAADEFADRVALAGARRVGYTATMKSFFGRDKASFADRDRFAGTDLARIQHGRLAEAVANLPTLAAEFDRDRPDLVVHSSPCWAARLLAARWAVPTVRSVPTFAGNEHWSLGRNYGGDGSSAGLAAVHAGLGRLIERLGVDLGADEFFTERGGRATLVYLPRAFQPAGDTFDPRTHFVGPCLGPRGRHGRWQPPPAGSRLALVSLGTAYNNRPEFFRRCVDSFADTDWHAVIALGGGLDPAALGPLPGNVQAHPFVPQLDVLKRADVFVSSAGMGSVMESLHAGVPVVAAPQMPEQRANADRIVELGLGARLDDVDALARTVDAVTSDAGVRARVADMRRQIDAAGGASAAADVVELALEEARQPCT
ncbi:macrolide family glycosyltransferase [Kutzneria buriramensis]|uniref:Demethyllactenocin mycarosyltransferase n=1 Tax=Kutzneria buriramensis TaxID=1045776 RepID=A0A3E0H1Q5_9PSEU|nr:macrolide family glycosyltransferase [Kutzneria buriramensis]REH35698.1 demethyllactenocin mycarosyltransferase [Kutzneria buriramensis]